MAYAGTNYLAAFIAALAAWIFGAIWYGALGKQWLAALGRTQEDMAMARGTFAFYRPFIVSFFCEIIMAYVLAGAIGHLGPGQVTVRNGIISGLIIWAGFVGTTTAISYGYSGRSLALWFIDNGHWLGVLAIMGAVLGFMGT